MGKFVITGGAGFIGSHVACNLLERGEEVVIFDVFHQYIYPLQPTFAENMKYRYEALLKGAQIERVDTANKDALRRLINEVNPDRIIHLAALPLANVALRQTEEAFQGIIQGTVNLLEVIRDDVEIERLVYVSSSMIYGDFATVPVPEDSYKDPKEIYGGMKYAGEILVQVFGKRFGIPYSIVRPSAVYGPTDNNRRVGHIFLENAFRGQPLRVKNGASTVLDFTYVEDIAEGLVRVALSPDAAGEAFNVTAGHGRSLRELADIVAGHFPGVEIIEEPDTETFRPDRGALDVSKAARLVGFEPRFDLETGIARYVDHMRRHNPSLSAKTEAPG